MTSEQVFQAAVSLQQHGRLAEAEHLYRTLLAAVPEQFDCLHNLGIIYLQRGETDEAIRLIRLALSQRPDSADAHNTLANVLQARGDPEEAIDHYKMAIAIEPGFAEAHNNLGNSLQTLGRGEQAIAAYEQALALKPDYAEACNNMGNAHCALMRQEDALAHYAKAVSLNPDYAEAHYNLGNALQHLDRPEQAVAHYERALTLRPDYADAHINLGGALQALNRHEKAIVEYEKALAIRPGDAVARWNESLAQLAIGDYRGGWPNYEWRQLGGIPGLEPRTLPQPLWLGKEPLVGRTILLHTNQGFGDTLQYVRYVPLLAARGAKVLLEVQRPLVSLLATVDGVSHVCAQDEPLLPFDYHCPLPGLPLTLDTRLETIPASVPYLRAAPDAVARWRSILGPQRRLRIGIAWAGNPGHRNDRNRSMPLASLRPLLATNLEFIVLQQELREGDAETLKSLAAITLVCAPLADFAETAAVISLLDLVITVDTAVAHLAGALGKSAWVLLPFSADWRWLVARTDSPWYPTARIFRQPAIGNWDAVITSVGSALSHWIRTEGGTA